MCTVLAVIHCNIHAVPQNDDIKLNHRSASVVMPDRAIRECRGGIDIDHLLGYFRVELPKYFPPASCLHYLLNTHKSIFQISRTAFRISGTLNKAL